MGASVLEMVFVFTLHLSPHNMLLPTHTHTYRFVSHNYIKAVLQRFPTQFANVQATPVAICIGQLFSPIPSVRIYYV